MNPDEVDIEDGALKGTPLQARPTHALAWAPCERGCTKARLYTPRHRYPNRWSGAIVRKDFRSSTRRWGAQSWGRSAAESGACGARAPERA
jgi:hypothetical protein